MGRRRSQITAQVIWSAKVSRKAGDFGHRPKRSKSRRHRVSILAHQTKYHPKGWCFCLHWYLMMRTIERWFGDAEAAGSSPVTSTKNPSTLSADFLFKPIGLAYHHALACISLPHSCGVYHHTVGVYTFIGLMRCSGFATDDMQNLRFDDIQGFALIKNPVFMRVFA